MGYLYWIWDHFAPVIFGLAGGIGYGLLTNYKDFDLLHFIIWPFIGSGVGALYIPLEWAGVAAGAATVFLASRAKDLKGLILKFFTPVTPVEKPDIPLVVPEIPEEIKQAEAAGEIAADLTIMEEIAALIERKNKQCQLHPRCSGCPHVLSNPTAYGTSCDYYLALEELMGRGKNTVQSVLRYIGNLVALQTKATEEVAKQAKTWLYRGIAGAVVSWFLYRGLVAILQVGFGITLPF